MSKSKNTTFLQYDRDADAAYLYLRRYKKKEIVATSVPFEIEGVDSMLVADLDANGQLIGIEFLPAKKVLSPKSLKAAERLT